MLWLEVDWGLDEGSAGLGPWLWPEAGGGSAGDSGGQDIFLCVESESESMSVSSAIPVTRTGPFASSTIGSGQTLSESSIFAEGKCL